MKVTFAEKYLMTLIQQLNFRNFQIHHSLSLENVNVNQLNKSPQKRDSAYRERIKKDTYNSLL